MFQLAHYCTQLYVSIRECRRCFRSNASRKVQHSGILMTTDECMSTAAILLHSKFSAGLYGTEVDGNFLAAMQGCCDVTATFVAFGCNCGNEQSSRAGPGTVLLGNSNNFVWLRPGHVCRAMLHYACESPCRPWSSDSQWVCISLSV